MDLATKYFIVSGILFGVAILYWWFMPVFGETRPLPQCIDFALPMWQHIHVSVKGISIPALVGISPPCFKELHTHTASGIIHIESNTPKDFTLRQFFDVWGKSTAGYLSLTINNETATFDTILKNGDKIVITP